MKKVLLAALVAFAMDLGAQEGTGLPDVNITELIGQLDLQLEKVGELAADDSKKEEYAKEILRLEVILGDLQSVENELDQEQQKRLYEGKRVFYYDWCGRNPAEYDLDVMRETMEEYLDVEKDKFTIDELVKKAVDKANGKHLNHGRSLSMLDLVVMVEIFPYRVEQLHNNKKVTWEHDFTLLMADYILLVNNIERIPFRRVGMDILMTSFQKLTMMVGLIPTNGDLEMRNRKAKYVAETEAGLSKLNSIKWGTRMLGK